MKMFKGFLFALTGLFIVVTLFSLLMPSRVMTVRSVVVHADVKAVFDKVSDLSAWKYWHPVFMQDSASVHLSNPSSGVHAFAAWRTGNKQNRLLITGMQPGSITATLYRDGKPESDNIISVTSLNDRNNVQAEWRVVTRLGWLPWDKFSGIFVDNITGPGYEKALDNLRLLVEGQP